MTLIPINLCLNLILMPFFNSIPVCIGTTGRMSVPNNRDHHYRNLRDRYSNCTYVDGNLELTWLQDEKLDLSFLQHIREVSGMVLCIRLTSMSCALAYFAFVSCSDFQYQMPT